MNAQRYARICEMLARRQPDLTICMEQVHKPHNVSAIIRTADAVGVHEVHAVWPGSRMRTMAFSGGGQQQLGTGENSPYHWRCGSAFEKDGECRFWQLIFQTRPWTFAKLITRARPVF
ncbi:tRNA (guanosine-2'-O)-methyltransferase [Salmonella enterica subsp. arizonae]|uniref:tRNA (Guanosine-2'-O)-methyltransferase n=1 Tax=Salmonella enterica subsp. arizonae TaxID=59203 RepID=A0A379SMM4_SALER|nr:tRNA (guanosine-2'-O)-methyltransferase [Salmonella enterica subsp. arizonae]